MKRLFILTSLIALILPVITAQQPAESSEQLSPERKVAIAEAIINAYYVEPVDRDTVVDEAIRAMLKTLDPHSAYSTPEETRELNEPLNGNFSGIGIQFNMSTDTLYVISTIAGGPSERVGILPGDRIITVNDTTIAGVKMRNTDVMKRLRGPKGTDVNLGVKRAGVDELIGFTVTRDDIPVYSVDAAYMADPATGYIRVSRFAEQTPDEFAEAIGKLRAQGMKNLIIDLQDNGGGYLNAAHRLAGHFLHKGDLVVYTEGRKVPSITYTTDSDGDFSDGRVVVLVNQNSASASEILSGALQDHDRAVIVGRRTFGKGLVQRPFPFPDGSMIRLTVSKYFTPSGRSIQKPYVKGHLDDYAADISHRYESGELTNPDSIKAAMPDSLRFTTLKTGRTVYGGGGITPDIFVPIDTTWYTPNYRDIVAKGVLYRYVLSYLDSHRDSIKTAFPDDRAFAAGFEITPDMMTEVEKRAADAGITLDPEQMERSGATLREQLKALLARDIYENGSYYLIINRDNPVFTEALSIINDPAAYNKILGK